MEVLRLAVERGNVYDGVFVVTAICDCDWSKKSQKHTYNGNGEVAVIWVL